MYYVVGLGNPDEEHKKNRHNVGFLALDFIRETLNLSAPEKSSQFLGRFLQTKIDSEEVILFYPDTYMNHSGSAVKKIVPKDEYFNLVVLYDDVALPLGEIRVSFDRGDGGHNGIKSIISNLGTKEFVRLRIGVGQTSFWTGKPKLLSGDALPKFVLGNFSTPEQDKLQSDVLPKVCEAVRTIVGEGYIKAMNQFN